LAPFAFNTLRVGIVGDSAAGEQQVKLAKCGYFMYKL
jgi:hypothetical protein